MNRSFPLLLLLLPLVACQTLRQAGLVRADTKVRGGQAASAALFDGEFDNHEQVWAAHEKSATALVPPHVVITLMPTPRDDWSIWHIRLDVATPIDAVWAMQLVHGADGTVTLLPYRALVAAPAAGPKFDVKQWTPLDACALGGKITATNIHVTANVAACAAIVPGIGAQASLLPLAIEREGEWLHARLYADQARGADAREDARKVQVFGGWAAINGAGPQGADDSKDWHMNRAIRLGNEGGRAALAWRDGKPSGYSLVLERLTYREGNIPVLKLSVIEDATGRPLAYAWANPEATRIGISLGWVQVGLDHAASATVVRGGSR
jgi:hypothetical protein